jgi:hypothetical protein
MQNTAIICEDQDINICYDTKCGFDEIRIKSDNSVARIMDFVVLQIFQGII